MHTADSPTNGVVKQYLQTKLLNVDFRIVAQNRGK